MPTSVIIALGAAGAAAGAASLGATAFMAAVVGSLAAAALSAAFAPSPPVAEEVSGRLATVREPVAAWQWIYGQVRVGGVITFIGTSGSDNKLLHMVITLAGHECEEIGTIYFDDKALTLDGSGDVTAPSQFAGRARVVKSEGDEAAGVQPFSALVSAGVGWESGDCQTGRAKIYVRLTWHENSYPQGIPNITAVVKGRKVLDPRFSPVERAYSNNAALCIADYLMSAEAGLGCDYDEIDEAELISAANVCDEQVARNAGSPTQYEDRYTANGSFFVNQPPREVLPKLLTAIAGHAIFIGGKWKILPGAYRTPTITLTADDLRGPLHIMPRLSKRDLCNGVKGVFVDPDQLYNPTDYPPVVNATYLTEDQEERIWREVDQPFQTSSARAQRIGKIQLEQTRQQIGVEWPGKLGCYRLQPGDTVMVTLSRYGWSEKVFEVKSSTLTFEDAGGGGVILGCDLVLRETASGVYDWNAGEETTIDLAADTDLPDPFADLDIANLTASSGTADLFRQGDGTIVPRVRLRWDEPTNPFLQFYEIQFARVAGSPTEWVDAPDVLIPLTEGFAHPVEDGVVYDLRIRACTSMGNKGEWAYVWGHTVVGKTELPSNVTGASAVQQAGLVVAGCNPVNDTDLDAIEVRYHDEGETDWEDAAPFANILRGETTTSGALPPGTWEILFKARDTSGNYSANVARVTLEVTASGFTTIEQEVQGPDWEGTFTNMVRHWTGVLTPESQDTADTAGLDTFDQFVPNPELDCYFEAGAIDKGIDAVARVYGDIVSANGPGETDDLVSPKLEIDTRLAAGSFDGFEPWTVGSANFRYLKARLHVDTSGGVPRISQFTPTIDAQAREEEGTYTTPAGGNVAVTFDEAFHQTPVLSVSPQGSGNVTASWDSLTTTGFTGYFKSGGSAAAGTASYRARGV